AAATDNPNKSFVNRVIYPASATCAPVSGADGCLVPTATRRLGAINIATLPRNWEGPGGWKGGNPWNGYFLSIVNYQDDVSAPVGRNELASSSSGTAVPDPTSVQSGTLYYWNPATSSYSSLPVDSASLATLSLDFTHTQNVGGRNVTVRICFGSTVPACPGAASAQPIPATISTASTAGGAGNLSKLESTAQATPPKVTISYRIVVDGSTKVDLLIAVNLGTLEARGVYAPAPAQGS
ncbi:MAG: hypothetical protein HYU54_00145, partial [Actinobacteria bacterium]|nr:hypothetical protein [Actinomycetota bacterium]